MEKYRLMFFRDGLTAQPPATVDESFVDSEVKRFLNTNLFHREQKASGDGYVYTSFFYASPVSKEVIAAKVSDIVKSKLTITNKKEEQLF